MKGSRTSAHDITDRILFELAKKQYPIIADEEKDDAGNEENDLDSLLGDFLAKMNK